MFVIKGDKAVARVYQDENLVEEGAKEQIQTAMNHVAFKGCSVGIMPDVHQGMGCVIGLTTTIKDFVIPNLVGVDIGCGVYAENTGYKASDVDFESVDRFIRENIPSGFSLRNSPLEYYFQNLCRDKDAVELVGADRDKADKSLGTLGGGNHFIELDEDPEGDLWLVIHSGSRNMGLRVANYFQDKAKKLCSAMGVDVPKDLEYLPMDFGGYAYLSYMRDMQAFAMRNRHWMAELILDGMFPGITDTNGVVESVHNYIEFKDDKPSILRKGAISAKEGQKVIIPLNMADGCIVGTGKGNKSWNYSAPHGAGRTMGRRVAKKTLSMEEYRARMEGIYSTSVSEATLDEAPMAYKDKSCILGHLEDTVDVDFIMKPVYSFKAS